MRGGRASIDVEVSIFTGTSGISFYGRIVDGGAWRLAKSKIVLKGCSVCTWYVLYES